MDEESSPIGAKSIISDSLPRPNQAVKIGRRTLQLLAENVLADPTRRFQGPFLPRRFPGCVALRNSGQGYIVIEYSELFTLRLEIGILRPSVRVLDQQIEREDLRAAELYIALGNLRSGIHETKPSGSFFDPKPTGRLAERKSATSVLACRTGSILALAGLSKGGNRQTQISRKKRTKRLTG